MQPDAATAVAEAPQDKLTVDQGHDDEAVQYSLTPILNHDVGGKQADAVML